MQVRKQQLELDMEPQTGSKLGKEYVKTILSPCLFNFYAEYIMRNAGLDEVQAVIKAAGRNINNLRNADETTLMAESEEESLDGSEREESKKVVLNLNIQKTKIMASSPITLWQTDVELRNSDRLYSKTLAPWKKSYDQPRQHIKKQRHYFANKGLSSQSYGFSSSHVWM